MEIYFHLINLSWRLMGILGIDGLTISAQSTYFFEFSLVSDLTIKPDEDLFFNIQAGLEHQFCSSRLIEMFNCKIFVICWMLKMSRPWSLVLKICPWSICNNIFIITQKRHRNIMHSLFRVIWNSFLLHNWQRYYLWNPYDIQCKMFLKIYSSSLFFHG